MKNLKSILLSFVSIAAVIASFGASAPACASSIDNTLRIGLVRNFKAVQQVNVNATCSFTVSKTGTNESALICPDGSPALFETANNTISVKIAQNAPVDEGACVTIIPSDPKGIIKIESPGRQSRQYRGLIEISTKSNALCLVNVIKPEEYLLGMLPSEMPPSYPEEALKAQAIAARTFALKNRNKHAADGFDICDRDHCQTYNGVASEDSRTNRAIEATNSLVLTYNKQLASTMYSTDCGGTTQNYSDVYPNSDYPYLCGVTDPSDIHKDSWEESFTLKQISDALVKVGVKEAKDLASIVVTKTGSSGRVLTLDVTGSTGTKKIYAETLRRSLGYDTIKSTLFTIESSQDEKITFKGKGYGHGVGLCQTGAKGLANPPYNYTCEQILSHYFPGTGISMYPSLASLPASQAAGAKQTKIADAEIISAKSQVQQPKSDEHKPKPSKPMKATPPSENGNIFEVRVKAPEVL